MVRNAQPIPTRIAPRKTDGDFDQDDLDIIAPTPADSSNSRRRPARNG